MPQGGYATPYHDLLAELRRRELAVREQQYLVDRFVLDMLTSANSSTTTEPVPKRKRTKSKIVHGFVIDALDSLPIDYHRERNGKVKLP